MKFVQANKEKQLQKKLWIGLIVLALLSPLGLLLPRLFNAEEAWGEWGPETLRKLLGYVPERLRQTADIWKAPFAGYSPAPDHPSLLFQVAGYILSALLGLVLILFVIYMFKRFLTKHAD